MKANHNCQETPPFANPREGQPDAARLFMRLNLYSAAVLAGVVVLFFVGLRLGYRRADLQTILFPIAVLAVAFLPNDRALRVPGILLVLAFLGWLVATLDSRGLLFTAKRYVFVSRMSGDEPGFNAQNISRHYAVNAKHFGWPSLKNVEVNLSNHDQALDWLQPDRAVVLFGAPPWPQVAVNPSSLVSSQVFKASDGVQSLSVSAKRKLAAWGISNNKDLLIVHAAEQELALLTSPRIIRLPLEPLDLAADYLGWLSQGLFATNYQDQDYAFLQGALLDGHWKGGAPRSLLWHYLGIINLLEGIRSGDLGLIRCANLYFGKAAGLVQSTFDPELRASILNNAAIARLLLVEEGMDLTEVKNALLRAGGISDKVRKPILGSQIAMYNLQVLTSGGVLEK